MRKDVSGRKSCALLMLKVLFVDSFSERFRYSPRRKAINISSQQKRPKAENEKKLLVHNKENFFKATKNRNLRLRCKRKVSCKHGTNKKTGRNKQKEIFVKLSSLEYGIVEISECFVSVEHGANFDVKLSQTSRSACDIELKTNNFSK